MVGIRAPPQVVDTLEVVPMMYLWTRKASKVVAGRKKRGARGVYPPVMMLFEKAGVVEVRGCGGFTPHLP